MQVIPGLVLPETELSWRFSRSSGPGGQSVNTTDSRAELSVDVARSTAFPEHLRTTTEIFASLFKATSPYMCTQPCYFGGPFALNWASDDAALLGVSAATLKSRMARRGIEARYYTAAGHLAAFALPGYVEKIVADAMRAQSKTRARSPPSARRRQK